MIKYSENINRTPQIVVIGIGGAGSVVLDKINNYKAGYKSEPGVTSGPDLHTILIDSDEETLDNSTAKEKFRIPTKLIKELVSESNNTLIVQGLAKVLKPFIDSVPKAEIVFTISGLGGNTGTAIMPYLVQLLKEKSHWVWSLCTMPFFFEGKPKILNSLRRLKTIQQSANSVLMVPHDKIFKMSDKNLSMKEVFTPANDLFAELVLDIDRLTRQDSGGKGINIKFSDIKEKITNRRGTAFWFGEAGGESRMQKAIEQAVNGPLFGKDILPSAESLIVSISGSEVLKLNEINSGTEYLNKLISRDMDIIFGVNVEHGLKDRVKIGIIVTGLDTSSNADSWDLSLSSSGATRDTGLTKRVSILSRSSQLFQKPQQTMIDFRKLSKGQFEKSEATVFSGEDLDIPTFLRKKK